ncbi:shikimate kinase [bacterium]|nr:shikimate kinase [bacterium]
MHLLSLWGYMGVGKTGLGKALSHQLDCEFADLDKVIEASTGRSPAQWIQEKGELGFRKVERDCLHDLLERFEGILACGGGTPCYYDNADRLLKASRCVYLSAGPGFIAHRLNHAQTERPLLRDLDPEQLPEFVAKHLFERRPFYEKAHITLKVEGLSRSEILDRLSEEFRAIPPNLDRPTLP